MSWSKKKVDKKIIELEPFFDNVLVCNDRKSQPYLEILVQDPENINTQNLGTLLGIFEVTDKSDDSSYIVNYLISVIKKEYCSKPRRGPIESFEAALHKANLALSKLAEHGNIAWIGKLNSLIAVIEKNNLHLSQTGNASAYLLRSKTLTDVSEGLAPSETEPYPLKTFVNVSSGKLEKNDKLIITTSGIFDIFSLEEIKKSALRFSKEEFTQFLKTALGSELERAAVLIADIGEKEKLENEPIYNYPREINAFSQAAFAKPSAAKNNHQVDDAIKEEIKKSKEEFVDEKTGHIYIKEAENNALQKSPAEKYLLIIKEQLALSASNFSIFLKNSVWTKIKRLSWPEIKLPNIRSKISKNKQTSSENKEIKRRQYLWLKNMRSFLIKSKEEFIFNFLPFLKNLSIKTRRILPDFKKLAEAIGKMDYQQRLYAVLAIILIFIVPLFGIKIKNNLDAKRAATLAQMNQPAPVPLEQDKNVARVSALNSVYSGNDILQTVNLNGKIFAVAAAEVRDLEKNKSFALPQDFGSPVQITGMDDLNLIFLMNKEQKIISFSPISGSFQNNNLVVPADANISAVGTYLTYIYLADAKNNQIYRYPRAEGGFGDKTNWLKDTTDISGTVDVAMSDNIFLADSSGITKLFKGKKQDFNIEETATPIVAYKISISPDSGNIYILDKQNARLIKLDGTGKIIVQYYNSEIASAVGFAISQNEKTAYLAASDSMKSFSLE